MSLFSIGLKRNLWIDWTKYSSVCMSMI